MLSGKYKKIKILIVDNVHSYRQYLVGILREAGIAKTDGVSSADEAIQLLSENQFDVVISEYDLGGGKNGLQLLEELRVRQLLGPQTLFIFLSSEMSRSVVVSAYDLDPDAYLTKPVRSKDLLQRLVNLLTLRDKLRDVYNLAGFLRLKETPIYLGEEKDIPINTDEGDINAIIDYLNTIVSSIDNPANKLRNICLKLLGRVYLHQGDLQSAEKIYRQVLEVLPVDWAKVGMAKIKKNDGRDDEVAGDLENIIQAHPLCLDAYDELIQLYEVKHEKYKHKNILMRVSELSPFSILRQEKLGNVSFSLNDFENASLAFQSTVKLGRFSVHDKFSNYVNFGRATNYYLRDNPKENSELLKESIKALDISKDRFSLSAEKLTQLSLVQCQAYTIQGNKGLAEKMYAQAAANFDSLYACEEADTEIDILNVKKLAFKNDLFEKSLSVDDLIERYANDENALEKIDKLLDDPVSQSNRDYIAKINKEGIKFYSKNEYKKSVECFEEAIKSFPNYIPLHLNLVQALHGYCSENADSGKQSNVRADDDFNLDNNVEVAKIVPTNEKQKLFNRANHILEHCDNKISESHEEYKRYTQLKEMMAEIAPCFYEAKKKSG